MSSQFDYRTLRDLAEERSAPPFSSDSRRIFDVLLASDFEGVMREIMNASRVVGALGGAVERLELAYANVRDALIGAVAAAHPHHSLIPQSQLVAANEFFSSFVSIFTTNYDLLLYWSVMKDPSRFVDFFWSREFNFAFDITNVSVSGTRTMVFYLHGALMLAENSEGHVRKLVNDQQHPVLLDSILDRIRCGDYPLFVSEGDTRAKMRSVARYTYLDFALARLGRSSGPTVVYGHGLGNVDAHIVSALARSARSLFAVGLWPKSAAVVEAERTRINAALGATVPGGSPRTIRYFDGSTLNAWTGAARPKR